MTNTENANSYRAGHPWYYVLGGTVLKPKEIMEKVKARNYEGYMIEDIRKADNKCEPQRSESLRRIKDRVLEDFWNDLSRYRQCATQLRFYDRILDIVEGESVCAEIHTSISLKYNHLYNDFAHLLKLDALLSKQQDLFGL